MTERTPFLDIKTRMAGNDEAEASRQPHHQHQQLLDTLRRAWDHNAAILRARGYVVTKFGAPPIVQDIREPEAMEAHHIIAAVHEVWSALFQDDKFALANAALWLGIVSSGQYFRRYQGRLGAKRTSASSRAVDRRLELGRAIYEAVQRKGRRPTFHDLRNGLNDAGISTTESQAKRLLTELNRT